MCLPTDMDAVAFVVIARVIFKHRVCLVGYFNAVLIVATKGVIFKEWACMFTNAHPMVFVATTNILPCHACGFARVENAYVVITHGIVFEGRFCLRLDRHAGFIANTCILASSASSIVAIGNAMLPVALARVRFERRLCLAF